MEYIPKKKNIIFLTKLLLSNHDSSIILYYHLALIINCYFRYHSTNQTTKSTSIKFYPNQIA